MSFLGILRLVSLRKHERAMELVCYQRDKETTRANKLAAELSHWKKHGQLRDPKTGRLIPKAKAGELVA